MHRYAASESKKRLGHRCPLRSLRHAWLNRVPFKNKLKCVEKTKKIVVHTIVSTRRSDAAKNYNLMTLSTWIKRFAGDSYSRTTELCTMMCTYQLAQRQRPRLSSEHTQPMSVASRTPRWLVASYSVCSVVRVWCDKRHGAFVAISVDASSERILIIGTAVRLNSVRPIRPAGTEK